MDEREVMLAAVLAAPSDAGPRLIYADWLEEHPEQCPEPWSIPALRYPGEWRFDQQQPGTENYHPDYPARLLWIIDQPSMKVMRFDCGLVGMRCPHHHPWQRQEPFACRHRGGQWLCYPCYRNRPLETPPARLEDVEWQWPHQAFGAASPAGFEAAVLPAEKNCEVGFDLIYDSTRQPDSDLNQVRLVRMTAFPSSWLFSCLDLLVMWRVDSLGGLANRWRATCRSRGPTARVSEEGTLTLWKGEPAYG